MSPKAIQDRAKFDVIRYANCWEALHGSKGKGQ